MKIHSESTRKEFETILNKMAERTGMDLRDLASEIFDLGWDYAQDSFQRCDCE